MRSAIICAKCTYKKVCPASIKAATTRALVEKEVGDIKKGMEIVGRKSGKGTRKYFNVLATTLVPEVERFMKSVNPDIKRDLTGLHEICKKGGGLKEEK